MSQAIVQADSKHSQLKTIQAFLEKSSGSIRSVLPKHMTPERLTKVALSACSRDEKLLECTPVSLFRAVMQAGELGLEAGGLLGEGYLVPFWRSYRDQNNNWQKVREVQFIPGYKGLLKLARQSGEVANISARVVHENDRFELELGLNEKCIHVPATDKDPGPLKLVYVVVNFKDGMRLFDFMTLSEILAVRDRPKPGQKPGQQNAQDGKGPWFTDFEEMAKKTVIKRVMKLCPLSPERSAALHKALEHDASIDAGGVGIDVPIPSVETTAAPETSAVASLPVSSPTRTESLTARLKREQAAAVAIDDPYAPRDGEELTGYAAANEGP